MVEPNYLIPTPGPAVSGNTPFSSSKTQSRSHLSLGEPLLLTPAKVHVALGPLKSPACESARWSSKAFNTSWKYLICCFLFNTFFSYLNIILWKWDFIQSSASFKTGPNFRVARQRDFCVSLLCVSEHLRLFARWATTTSVTQQQDPCGFLFLSTLTLLTPNPDKISTSRLP